MSKGVSFAELLRRSTSVPVASAPPRLRPVRNTLPASLFDPKPEPQPGRPSVADTLSTRFAREPSARTTAVGDDGEGGFTKPARDIAAPPAVPGEAGARPRRPGAVSDRELYSRWVQLTTGPETRAITGWPSVYLAARELGLTRLGNGNYEPEQWRKAVQRLVREEDAIPFWFCSKGRPPHIITTQQHLAAWGIAGYHRRLGQRRRT